MDTWLASIRRTDARTWQFEVNWEQVLVVALVIWLLA